MDPASLNFFLAEMNRRFDELEARMDQRFSPPPTKEPRDAIEELRVGTTTASTDELIHGLEAARADFADVVDSVLSSTTARASFLTGEAFESGKGGDSDLLCNRRAGLAFASSQSSTLVLAFEIESGLNSTNPGWTLASLDGPPHVLLSRCSTFGPIHVECAPLRPSRFNRPRLAPPRPPWHRRPQRATQRPPRLRRPRHAPPHPTPLRRPRQAPPRLHGRPPRLPVRGRRPQPRARILLLPLDVVRHQAHTPPRQLHGHARGSRHAALLQPRHGPTQHQALVGVLAAHPDQLCCIRFHAANAGFSPSLSAVSAGLPCPALHGVTAVVLVPLLAPLLCQILYASEVTGGGGGSGGPSFMFLADLHAIPLDASKVLDEMCSHHLHTRTAMLKPTLCLVDTSNPVMELRVLSTDYDGSPSTSLCLHSRVHVQTFVCAAVPHMQPWPPPVEFGMLGGDAHLRPATPWPSLSSLIAGCNSYSVNKYLVQLFYCKISGEYWQHWFEIVEVTVIPSTHLLCQYLASLLRSSYVHRNEGMWIACTWEERCDFSCPHIPSRYDSAHIHLLHAFVSLWDCQKSDQYTLFIVITVNKLSNRLFHKFTTPIHASAAVLTFKMKWSLLIRIPPSHSLTQLKCGSSTTTQSGLYRVLIWAGALPISWSHKEVSTTFVVTLLTQSSVVNPIWRPLISLMIRSLVLLGPLLDAQYVTLDMHCELLLFGMGFSATSRGIRSSANCLSHRLLGASMLISMTAKGSTRDGTIAFGLEQSTILGDPAAKLMPFLHINSFDTFKICYTEALQTGWQMWKAICSSCNIWCVVSKYLVCDMMTSSHGHLPAYLGANHITCCRKLSGLAVRETRSSCSCGN